MNKAKLFTVALATVVGITLAVIVLVQTGVVSAQSTGINGGSGGFPPAGMSYNQATGTPTSSSVDLLNPSAGTDAKRTRLTVDSSGNFTIVPVNDTGVVTPATSFSLSRSGANFVGWSYQDSTSGSLSYAVNDFNQFAAPNSQPLYIIKDAGTTGALAGFAFVAGAGANTVAGILYCQGGASTLGLGLTNGPAAPYCQLSTNDLLFGFGIANAPLSLGTDGIEALRLDVSQNVVVHSKATSAVGDTTGFLYIESVAGQPTGVPVVTYTNAAATRVDTTNKQFCYYNAGWQCATAKPILSGTTGSIGGSLLAPGACTSGTVTITGAAVGMDVKATPSTYPGDGTFWDSYISATNTITVKVCAIISATPTASVYNARVLQ